MDKSAKAILAALLGYSIFGFSFLFSKLALDVAAPSVLLAIRFLVAFGVLNLMLLAGKQKITVKGKPVGKLLLMGLIQPVIYFICEANGIALTTASFSGVMIGLSPVAGLLFGVLFLKETCTLLQVGCTLLSVLGVALTTTGGFGSFSLPGFLLLLGAVLSAAAFTVISRSISGHFSAFERTYVMFAMGSVVFTGMALVQNDRAAWLAPLGKPFFWVAVAYLAVLSSVCAFLLINYAVNYVSAGHTLILSNFTSVISVLAGILILKDSFTPLQLAGIAIILVSVFGVSWQSGKQVKAQ